MANTERDLVRFLITDQEEVTHLSAKRYLDFCDKCRSQIEDDKERETRQKCWEDYRWAYDGGCDDEPEAYKYLKQKWGIVK